MTDIAWYSIEYKEVNNLQEHYKNQKGPRTFSMLAPSDVPSHFAILRRDGVIEIKFRYMNESEKRKQVSILDKAIHATIGKASKKIYSMRIDIDELNKAMEAATNKNRLIHDSAISKVKKTSYSAIKEIYNKYLKQHLANEQAQLAF